MALYGDAVLYAWFDGVEYKGFVAAVPTGALTADPAVLAAGAAGFCCVGYSGNIGFTVVLSDAGFAAPWEAGAVTAPCVC